MNRGWIKKHRKTLDSPIWELPPLYYKAFDWLLFSANHKPRKVYVSNLKAEITVGRGELITSRKSLAKALRWKYRSQWIEPTEQEVRSILDKLESCKMVTRVSTEGCLHLRIDNYELYQSKDEAATKVSTGVATGVQPECNPEQELKNERSSNGEGYQPKYSSVLTILHGIEGWPVDPKKDDSLIRRNRDTHSLTLEQLEQAAIELATWYDDNPGEIEKPKANPRIRFNTFARNRAKWDRESGLSDGASSDGQSHRTITAGRIRQDATSYLIRAASGQMSFEEFGAAILDRYKGQTVSPDAIQGAWDLAQREFGGSDRL